MGHIKLNDLHEVLELSIYLNISLIQISIQPPIGGNINIMPIMKFVIDGIDIWSFIEPKMHKKNADFYPIFPIRVQSHYIEPKIVSPMIWTHIGEFIRYEKYFVSIHLRGVFVIKSSSRNHKNISHAPIEMFWECPLQLRGNISHCINLEAIWNPQ